jgi:hypothetical protein
LVGEIVATLFQRYRAKVERAEAALDAGSGRSPNGRDAGGGIEEAEAPLDI